jgi:hypothetical protein
MTLLTKTDFISFRECPNNVWVKRNLPDVYAQYPVSEFEKSLGVMGNEVEELARGMFPEGVLIHGRGKDAENITKKLIQEKTPVIFQALFTTDRFLAATDVLKWNTAAGAYDLYEIKMSSTSEEDEDETEDGKPRKVNKKKERQYEYDLAFQANVVELCGVKINKKYLIRLNREYVRMGELDFSPNGLFIIEDKTEAIEKLVEVALTEMEQVHSFVFQVKQPEGHCPCYFNKGRSSHCTTFAFLNPDVPKKNSVHDLNRIGNSKALLKELLDEGKIEIKQISVDDKRLLPKKQKDKEKQSKPRKFNQVKVHHSKEPIVDLDAIKYELNSLTFPLYFLDYETYPTAIPPFSGYHPYQHIVFQYSLHVLRDKDAKLEHYEVLVLEGDPAETIVAGLREHIGDTGSVISWYKKFENSRNRELAQTVPLQYEFLHDVINRTYDLMDIVENQYYVHRDFEGRSSIKKVLPALAPEFSYDNLAVRSGTDAIEAYRQISTGQLVGEAVEEKKKQMLEYCKRDTEAMYVLWKFFAELVEKNGS